jgi:hypothetical protein
LCNYVYWRALQRAPHGSPLVQFVHIPPIAQRMRPARPRGKKLHAPTLAHIVTASENLLIALVAARKH